MGQGDGEGPVCETLRFPAMVRDQGKRAALAGAPPSTCPYRSEDSRARLLWLEGYLAGLDSDACPPIWRTYRPLADMLRCAVDRNLTLAKAGNVVRFTRETA